MDPMGEEEEACLKQRSDEGGGAEGTTYNVQIVGQSVTSHCIEELGRGRGGSPLDAKGEGEAEGKGRGELELLLDWCDDQGRDQAVSGTGGSIMQSGSSQSLLAQERDGWASFPSHGHSECSDKHATVDMGNGKVVWPDLHGEEVCSDKESSDVFPWTPTTVNPAIGTARRANYLSSVKSTSSDEFGDFDWQGPMASSQTAPTVGISLPEQWMLLCKEVFPSLNDSCQDGERAVGEGGGCACTPRPIGSLAEGSPLWRDAVGDALSPRPELWSHPVIDHGFGNAVRVVCSQRQSHLRLKLSKQDGGGKDSATVSPCEDFDWSLEDASPFLLNLRELSLGNVSPETATMVAYLRSNVVSPVEVEMDIEQATAGLSLLSEDELEAMIEEMQAKFNRLSESLIDGLQEREELVQERDVRHKFIAAVHQLVQHRQNHSFGPGGGGPNLAVKELKRLTSKRVNAKEKSPVKYLHTVIPYTARPIQVPWNLDTLEKLTRILGAIQSNLDVIPALMREYLTECLELDLEGSSS